MTPAVEGSAAIEAIVLDEIATLCRMDRRALTPSTRLLELGLDSLSLIALLTRLELALDVQIDDAEALGLVEADDVGALCRRVTSAVTARRGE